MLFSAKNHSIYHFSKITQDEHILFNDFVQRLNGALGLFSLFN